MNTEIGAEVFFKCESLQRMGAFKFRGAFNALSQFDERQRKAGVVTYSSGNHAQAIALSSSLLGIPATIVMPDDAPAARWQRLAVTAGRWSTMTATPRIASRSATRLRKSGLTLIPPYDHPDVIAGQGTAAKELFEEVGELDALFVCLGGGGLLSGSALSARALSPRCKIYGVEPEAGNDGQRSFRAGSIVHIDTPKTIADGAQTQHLGAYTFEIIRRDVDDIPDRFRCAARRWHALFCRTHEAGRRTDRLSRARRRSRHGQRAQGPACRRRGQRRQRRS